MNPRPGPIDPTGPRRRGYEQTWWGKLYVHYKLATPIISGGVLLIMMFGFNFQTPAQLFAKIDQRFERAEARMSALEDIRRSDARATEEWRSDMLVKLDVVVRDSCRRMTVGEREITPVCDQVGK